MSDTSTPTADLIGRTLGRYRIEELLGRGGMAWVYRAWDQDLERTVAVKVITPQEALEMAQSMDRFHREARVIARLDHPHIVQLYDLGKVDGQPYMVMQYIPGPNLEDRLREWSRCGRLLARDEVLTILRQVAAALDYAHAQGLIHRDVKPSNVLFKEDGHVVLTDFGLARLHAGVRGQHPTLTDADQVLGTPTYMAPEQATRTIPASPASDVYSLAVVAYEMLSGQPPFEADSTLSAILQHILEPPPSIRERRPDLSPALDQTLQRALDKDPAQRFLTATAFVDALEAAWEDEKAGLPDSEPAELAVHSPPAEPVQPAPLPLAPTDSPTLSPTTRQVAWESLGLGVVLVGGVIVVLLVALLLVVGLLYGHVEGFLGGPGGTASSSPTPTEVPRPSTIPATPPPSEPPAISSPTVLPVLTTIPPPSVTATESLTYHAIYLGSREAGGTFIRGRVTDRDERPVPGALVELYSPEWKWLRTVGTNTDGRYEFIVSPNVYYLRLKNRPCVSSARITVKFSQEATVNWVEGE